MRLMRIMGKKPLVSVIIASYNHVDYVEEAVRSVLDQTIYNIEVIIVDDGSTDGTDKAIKQIIDKRIRFIRLPDNRLTHPRNLALKKARGKYIAFQNSDDIWLNNKLETQIEQFKIDKNLAVCFTDVEVISGTGKTLAKSWASGLFANENQASEQWLRRFFDFGNCLCLSSAIMKKSLFNKTGVFDESLIQLSDYDLWTRMALQGDFYVTSKKLTKMRVVKKLNVSFPTPTAQRRSTMEEAYVLEQFTNEKVNLYDIFPDVVKDRNLPRPVQLTYLANYAWEKSLAHKLFADRLFTELFRNTKSRDQITSHFGARIYKEFTDKRGRIGIAIHA